MTLRSDILNPIEGQNRAGVHLLHEALFAEIKEARRADDDGFRRPGDEKPKSADWSKVYELSSTALATKSKDLELASWLTESLLHREGFSGLKAGLDVLTGLLEQYWDALYPPLVQDDEDPAGDRAARLTWVGQVWSRPDKGRVTAIQDVPLTRKGYGLFRYKESQKVGSEAGCEGDEAKLAARKKLIDEGKIPAEEFQRAFDDTPKDWYKSLNADLNGSLASLAVLEAAAKRLMPNDPPAFADMRGELQAVQAIARQLLEEKLKVDPDPIDTQAATADEGTGELAAGDDGTVPIEPRNLNDAVARIAAVARYLRQQDPANLAAYLMLRALRWGELRSGGGAVDPRTLAPPSPAVRAQLRGLLLDGRWRELLELCENIMARPEGRGWLDLQRYAVTACANLGGEFEGVGRAIRGALEILLKEVPSLPEMVLMDDMPTANAETKQWLATEHLIAEATDGDGAAPLEAAAPERPVPRETRGLGDLAYQRAKSAIQNGQPKAAIEILMAEVARERSSRARFLRRTQIASIMVDAGLEPLAKQILEELLSQVESHSLEDWEAGDVIAQPLALMYKVLAKMEADSDRRGEIYLRIAKLDPVQAINLQS
jgi:type VI secretion system protein ImpA